MDKKNLATEDSLLHDEDVVKKELNEEYNQWNVHGTCFTLPKRYEVKETCGSGAYGTVVSALDTKKGREKEVAIKKIERTFEHPLYAKRTLREIKILRLLRHENVIDIKTIIKPPNLEKFDEIYVVCELMETDLGSIIRSEQDLSIDHIRFFMYQLLRGMKYVHSAGILHRDLKPKNLLVNSNCDLKICDFGLSRADIPELYDAGAMTDYVSTRWYRAPEVLLGSENYTTSIDMWAIGCIFAELLTRKPFLPGIDAENQLKRIVEMVGSPDADTVSLCGGTNVHLLKGIEVDKDGDTSLFKDKFGDTDPIAKDLLKQMLVFNPFKRISIANALAHPFFEDLHYEPDEPTTTYVSPFDFDFEKYDLQINETKEEIYEEICLYHSAKAQKKYVKNRKEHPKGILHLKYPRLGRPSSQ